MKLSIVSTLFRSSPFLDEFVARACRAAETVSPDYELILVDDGSPDDSLGKAIALARADGRIRVVELARNFGHHAAILVGLAEAQGERIFLVDSDLEDEPELLLTFAAIMDHDDVDVIYGIHDQVAGTKFRQWTSGGFWRLFNLMSNTKIEENLCHVRLMRQSYRDALLALPERNLFLGGLYAWPGFKQRPVKISRQIRRARSTYSVVMRISLLIRSVVAFSTRPLQFIFGMGMLIAGLSCVVAMVTFVDRLVIGRRMISGFASLLISIWFLSGLIIMSLGVIGLYLGQIYLETKARPRAFVRRIHEFPRHDRGSTS